MMSQQPTTLTDRVRKLTSGLMTRLGTRLYRLGLHPDMITVLGLLIVMIASVVVAAGYLQWGGIILLLGLPLDAVDGAVARAMQRKDKFGAMLDSSLDRYADGLIFGALSYYFAVQDEFGWMVMALAAILGSFMVSYTRARAEGLGVDVKIGLFSRLERVIVILGMLLTPDVFGIPILEIGLLVLAVGTNFTGMQRLWYVYRTLMQREDKS
ncbi:MAG: CDP-alcohol phosphatidyltransferase family protein [Phototrophicales bacterium]|nr:MAG: CDP-alcohol phosphatidyltransferase family protein [Phototrophicales bacterium]RMG70118.1 MAG: CDP-alcohol phosphatidyltransferase family protein [Chloroflexota bacterium]